jgi:hypothetical protein
MATCNLCPGSPQLPDDEMADHLRTAHPDVAEDGTSRSDDSAIVRDSSLAPDPDETRASDWRSA